MKAETELADFLADVCRRVETLVEQRAFAEPMDLLNLATRHTTQAARTIPPISARQHAVTAAAHLVIFGATVCAEPPGELMPGDMS